MDGVMKSKRKMLRENCADVECQQQQQQQHTATSRSPLLLLLTVCAMLTVGSWYHYHAMVRFSQLEHRLAAIEQHSSRTVPAAAALAARRGSRQRPVASSAQTPSPQQLKDDFVIWDFDVDDVMDQQILDSATSSAQAPPQRHNVLSVDYTDSESTNNGEGRIEGIEATGKLEDMEQMRGLDEHGKTTDDNDDDEDDEESGAGEISRSAPHSSRTRWNNYIFTNWQLDNDVIRRRRSVDEEEMMLTDDSSMPRHGRRRQQQQQQEGEEYDEWRWAGSAGGERRRLTMSSTTTEPNSMNNRPSATPTSRRHRDNRRLAARQLNPATAQEDNLLSEHCSAAMKAAHFVAPAGHENQYTSDSNPPATFRFWRAENWTSSCPTFYHLNTQRGIVSIQQSGLYMVYAQMVYHDQTGRWSFGVFVDDKERLKCLDTEHSHPAEQQTEASRGTGSHGVYQHCYTAAVLRLDKHDTVSIRCMYGSRTVLVQPEFTFWGLIKLADLP